MSGIQVIYVDDEPDLLELVNIYFADHEIPVFTCLNAQVALEVFPSHPIKVVVSDARMPGMKGVDLYHHLNDVHQYEGVFILVSGNYDAKEVEDTPEGIAFTVNKPVDFDELASTIKKILGDSR